MQVGPFELIHLPGHCPGHVAIQIDDAVFCGDMVVEGMTTHISPEELTPFSGLGHYLESLYRLQEWSNGARLIFNGHDEVIMDFSASAKTARSHLARRLSQALDALDEPCTTADVCNAIYGNVGGYNALLVIEKTGAYVEYLYEYGMVEIANAEQVEQGLPAKYRRLREIADDFILPVKNTSVVE
jgi:glyoxylase-like metal-dependent hydrolase (beta-lactamase superfamily II)